MNYSTMSFQTLRRLYDIHQRAAIEHPELLTESDHAERLEIALELDRRLAQGSHCE